MAQVPVKVKTETREATAPPVRQARAVETELTTAKPPAREAWPDVSVELLADRVMKQIDRRLVAHRERLGRV